MRFSSIRRSCLRDRAGTTATEFALVLPLFTAMVFSVVEVGLVFFVYSDMYASAESVARQVAVNRLSVSNAVDATKAKLPAWIVNYSTVTVSQSNVADPSKNLISINITAPVTKATPISFFTSVAPWTMNVTASVNQERVYVD